MPAIFRGLVVERVESVHITDQGSPAPARWRARAMRSMVPKFRMTAFELIAAPANDKCRQ